MRILHVVALISPDGAYGGPVSVAVNQARALREQGHEVDIAAATRGFEAAPRIYEGVPAHLFPARVVVRSLGFAGIVAPGLVWWLWKNVQRYDVIHVHTGRDLITLPAARLALARDVPLITQTHGMIDRSSKRLAAVLDRFLTVPVLRRAHRILFLTPSEKKELLEVGAPASSLAPLPNGIAPAPDFAHSQRANEVLFLARLHTRKRPSDFCRAAIELAPKHHDWIFTLLGPDEGEGDEVAELVERDPTGRVHYDGPISHAHALERLARSAIYVLPSVDEPFPMSVLEAMSVGTPVVITNSNGLADLVERHQAGAVVAPGAHEVATGIDRLITDASARLSAGDRARQAVANELSIVVVAQQLDQLYAETVMD